MTVIAHRHRPGSRDREEEPGRWATLFKAVATVVLVTVVVAAALGGATYVASKAFIAMLS